MLPVKGFSHQRNNRGTTTSEEHRADWHSVRGPPFGRNYRALAGRSCESGIRVSRCTATARLPRSSQPVGKLGGSSSVMPSHQTSQSVVKAQLLKTVFLSTVRIALRLDFSLVPGATPNIPASGLIAYNRPSGSELHPRNVIAYSFHFPARDRRDKHR